MVAVGDCSVGDSRLRRTPYIIDLANLYIFTYNSRKCEFNTPVPRD